MRRLLLAVTGVVAIAGMLGAAATADAQKRGGTLRVAYGNEILGLDFHSTPGYEGDEILLEWYDAVVDPRLYLQGH